MTYRWLVEGSVAVFVLQWSTWLCLAIVSHGPLLGNDMFLRPRHYEELPFRGDRPRHIKKSARKYLPRGIPKRESLTIKMHKARMMKARLESERKLAHKRAHDNPSMRERKEAYSKLFAMKRRVVDRLLQRKAGNGFGNVRQDTRVLLQAYREIDADGSGGVSYDEFERALGPDNLDIGLTPKEVHELCIACDIDGNGDITFQEFLETLINADKPNSKIMLDRARGRENKFLKETIERPVVVKGEPFISSKMPTVPLFEGIKRPLTSDWDRGYDSKPTESALMMASADNARPCTTLSPIRTSALGGSKSQPGLVTSPVCKGDKHGFDNSSRGSVSSLAAEDIYHRAASSDSRNPHSSGTAATLSVSRLPSSPPLLSIGTGRNKFEFLFTNDANAVKGADVVPAYPLPVPRATTASSISNRQHFVPLKRRQIHTKPHHKTQVSLKIDPSVQIDRDLLQTRSRKNTTNSPKLHENEETWKRVGIGREGTLPSSDMFEDELLRRSPLRLNKSFDEKGKGWQDWEKRHANQTNWEWKNRLVPREIKSRQGMVLNEQVQSIVDFNDSVHEIADQVRIKTKSKQRYRYMQHIEEMNKLAGRKAGESVGKGLLQSPTSRRHRAGQIGSSGMSLA